MANLPEFRNIFTVGNIVSALATVFIGGMAWASVQGDIKFLGARVDKLEKNDENSAKSIQNIKENVATLTANSVSQEKSLERIEDWLKSISQKINTR